MPDSTLKLVELLNYVGVIVLISTDADRLSQIHRDVLETCGPVKAAEPCDCLPDAIRAEVAEIQSRYWSVFPMETSLYAASISLENYARKHRQEAMEAAPPDARERLKIKQMQHHEAFAWLDGAEKPGAERV